MSRSWLIIVLASCLLAGCADSTSDSETDTDTTAPEATEESAASSAESIEVANPEVIQVQTAAPATDPNQVNFSTSSAGLNPAHGQPGHDCAIPVGAPLDGSGAQTQAQPITAPVATQPVAQPNFSSGAAPANGINPAHGQPGHDCAVAVGAPLPTK